MKNYTTFFHDVEGEHQRCSSFIYEMISEQYQIIENLLHEKGSDYLGDWANSEEFKYNLMTAITTYNLLDVMFIYFTCETGCAFMVDEAWIRKLIDEDDIKWQQIREVPIKKLHALKPTENINVHYKLIKEKVKRGLEFPPDYVWFDCIEIDYFTEVMKILRLIGEENYDRLAKSLVSRKLQVYWRYHDREKERERRKRSGW